MIKICPHCGDEIPAVLYEAHIEACETNPETSSSGALLERESEPELPNVSSSLPDPNALVGGGEELFGDMSFPTPPLEEVQAEEQESDEQSDQQRDDDEFTRLVGQLDIDPSIIDVNVTTLDDLELNRRFTEVKQELLNRKEMIDAKTQTGRDLHSQRAAYLIELRKRGLSD